MRASRVRLVSVVLVLVFSQCAAPKIDDVLWACSNDSDCGPRFFCDLASSACVEGEGPSGLRTDPFFVDPARSDLVVNAAVQRDSEACFAIITHTPTRIEAQTAGSCESSASDTVLRFFDGRLDLLLKDDDGSGIGACSQVVTDELAAGTYLVCVAGFEGASVAADLYIRIGEKFAKRAESCIETSTLRGCDPAEEDFNSDGVTDILRCESGRCEPSFRLPLHSECVPDVDLCEVGSCLLYQGEENARCGEPIYLNEGQPCDRSVTGEICVQGTRCRDSLCQDCVVDDPGRPLLMCGKPRTYAESQAICSERGMRLVSADGREKDFDVYERAAVEFGYDGQYWLGMDDIQLEGFYVWSDGRTWDGQEEQYEDWGDEEPSRSDAQDCIATEEAGSWADFDCQTTHATICEPAL